MTEQLEFGFDRMFEEDASAHLPAEMQQGIACYREMIDRHNAAMLAADVKLTMAIRKQARRLATKLNDGDPGILADGDSPGRVLERENAAPIGVIPLWGQAGAFTLTIRDTPIRIELEGMFGIGAHFDFWLGFSAHVVDTTRPFITETGYRSFGSDRAEVRAGLTPEKWCELMIEAFLAQSARESSGPSGRHGVR